MEKLSEVNNNLKTFESVEAVAKELIKGAKEISNMDPCKLSDEYIAELMKKATELGELYEENDAKIKQLRSEQDHARARLADAVRAWEGFSVETREFFKVILLNKIFYNNPVYEFLYNIWPHKFFFTTVPTLPKKRRQYYLLHIDADGRRESCQRKSGTDQTN